MADHRFWERRAQTIENRLVGNLARQSDVTRRDFSDVRIHQRPAPVRGRPRQMSYIVRREPREMIGDGLVGIRHHERRAANNSAKINLHSAIAADVVKSSPDGGTVGGARCLQRRREAREIVHDHFRNAGRPRGHQHPLSAQQIGRAFRHGNDRGLATDLSWKPEHRQRWRSVVNDRSIDLRGSGDRGQMTNFDAGRQNHDTPCNAFEFDQRQRSAELTLDRKQDGALGKRCKPRTEN